MTKPSKAAMDTVEHIERHLLDGGATPEGLAAIIDAAAYRMYAPLIGELLDHLLAWVWECGDYHQWICPACGGRHHKMAQVVHTDDCDLGQVICKARRVIEEPKL